MKLLNLMVDSGTKLVMGVSAIAVLVVTFAQVLFRYVLKSPLPWSQDVLRLANCRQWPSPTWYSGEPPGASGKRAI